MKYNKFKWLAWLSTLVLDVVPHCGGYQRPMPVERPPETAPAADATGGPRS
ncbi:MAG: hypothetical protein HY902_10680 [Deltaproteobacteria bacterium]|nr:hypothetical protein [Deltaproteobacteria bacterium]